MKSLFLRLLQLPASVVLEKVALRLTRIASQLGMRIRDRHASTYACHTPRGSLTRLFNDPVVVFSHPESEQLTVLSGLVLAHRFDLLGSGWVRVHHGMEPGGVEGHRYPPREDIIPDTTGEWLTGRVVPHDLEESKRLWRQLRTSVDRSTTDYCAIDWHLDYKSGHRWSETTWYRDIGPSTLPGVDIKVPWELARMQHLTWLAQAFGHFRRSPSLELNPQQLQDEYCHQVLDFMATNPPRFGVNWVSTMDVAIRVSNWLVAYEMFRSQGAIFAPEFEEVFRRSIYEHGEFIIRNLEYGPELRTNHYLSNVVGLLFCAAWLPDEKETQGWLPFAIQELVSEMSHQFHADGSNFEASVSYHRLSTEMMRYAAAICRTLPDEKRSVLKNYDHRASAVRRLRPLDRQEYDPESQTLLPSWFEQRLQRALKLPARLTKPSGEVPQLGDNDSGRFLKLWPRFRRVPCAEVSSRYHNLSQDGIGLPGAEFYWDEAILDHSHLIAVERALFGGETDKQRGSSPRSPEFQWLHSIVCGETQTPRGVATRVDCDAPVPDTNRPNAGFRGSLDECVEEFTRSMGPPLLTRFQPVSAATDLTEGLTIETIQGLGIHLAKSPSLYAAIRCGDTGQNGNGGHAHNDQLSLELTLEGLDRTIDPGTYLYTPLPDRRNEFRSTTAHFTPRPSAPKDAEQATWTSGASGLFRLGNEARATVHYFGEDGWDGQHDGFNEPVVRVVRFSPDAVEVLDFGAASPGGVHSTVSNGYGRLSPNSIAGSLPPSRRIR